MSPRPLLAAPDDAAFRLHHDRALRLYQSQRYDEALVELEAAFQARPDPRLHLNLGHTLRRLGRHEEALRHYGRYREEVPGLSSATLASVEEYMALSRQALERAEPKAEPPAPERPALAPTPIAVEPPKPTPAPPGAGGPGAEPPRLAPIVLLRSPAPPPSVPVYRRWWFWGLVGFAAAGGAIAAMLATQPWDANLPPGAPIHDPKF